jgi:hypothetical protein
MGLLAALPVSATEPSSARLRGNDLLLSRPFLQIPGPNPILTPGEPGRWDSTVVEAADAFKDFGTYYLYYHAVGSGGHYQLGVATSRHPLGPFTKHGDAPILPVGPADRWDSRHAACGMVLKEGPGKYYMWYSGYGMTDEHAQWGIGLATAGNPLGPWTKHPSNPLIKHFGYVGGVVKVDGRYMLYTAHPIGSVAPDYSPMSLAVSEKPEGPYTEYANNPVMKEGEPGEWDDGGISEAEVLYFGDVFHMFYGGAKVYEPRIATRESIGYAYSFDGYRWTKYGGNPVATRDADPNASAFAEVHAIHEAPFIYLYHTLRYRKPWRDRHADLFPGVEDLGVQVLVTQRPFKLDMPVIRLDQLPAGATTKLIDSPNVSLTAADTLALTVQCTFVKQQIEGLRVHVRSSTDGLAFDTVDLATLEMSVRPGETVRQTFSVDARPQFVKVIVENVDKTHPALEVQVIATLGG